MRSSSLLTSAWNSWVSDLADSAFADSVLVALFLGVSSIGASPMVTISCSDTELGRNMCRGGSVFKPPGVSNQVIAVD